MRKSWKKDLLEGSRGKILEMTIAKLKNLYSEKKPLIESRLREFRQIWDTKGPEDIFVELVYCLLTPQSKAKICWNAVKSLLRTGILWTGNEDDIRELLYGVRFKNRKANYIYLARRYFFNNGRCSIREKINWFPDIITARDWLVKDIRGLGYKEASHFLRNIGLAEDLAILDRHILKSLKSLEVIEKIPHSLTRKRYLEIEEKVKNFASQINIPVSHLDLLLWSTGSGEIFK